MHIVPSYVVNSKIDSLYIPYIWDDTRAGDDFTFDPQIFLDNFSHISLHGKYALGIGIYEWIVWRYNKISEKSEVVFYIAEAEWCASISPLYVEYIELNRKEYLGPVDGPLWCAATMVSSMTEYGPDEDEDCDACIAYLIQLAMHVLPDTKIFEQWLDAAIKRLMKDYPQQEEDPFENLFEEDKEERKGPLVAREALDPSFDYHPDQAPRLLDQFLRSVDYKNNPFLRSPEELMELGIEHPYRLLP